MDKMLAVWGKQPDETIDVDISYAEFLAARGDTGTSHQVTVPAGLTLENSSLIDGVVKVWLSGGTHRQDYPVKVLLTTAGGRVEEADFIIRVREIGQ